MYQMVQFGSVRTRCGSPLWRHQVNTTYGRNPCVVREAISSVCMDLSRIYIYIYIYIYDGIPTSVTRHFTTFLGLHHEVKNLNPVLLGCCLGAGG